MKQNEKYDEKKVAERHRDHALFIAYAPAAAPTIALGILVENGGHGSATAAPIARVVLDYYLLGKLPGQGSRPQSRRAGGIDVFARLWDKLTANLDGTLVLLAVLILSVGPLHALQRGLRLAPAASTPSSSTSRSRSSRCGSRRRSRRRR